MSISLHYAEVSEPHLLDVVDDEWARDRMPNDGESHYDMLEQQDCPIILHPPTPPPPAAHPPHFVPGHNRHPTATIQRFA